LAPPAITREADARNFGALEERCVAINKLEKLEHVVGIDDLKHPTYRRNLDVVNQE
jgi:hypothetical protein